MVQARVRVIYGDTDQMGVVYYANYFRYFEFARSEFLRAHGRSYREMEAEGLMLPVVEATCRYRGTGALRRRAPGGHRGAERSPA